MQLIEKPLKVENQEIITLNTRFSHCLRTYLCQYFLSGNVNDTVHYNISSDITLENHELF